MMEVNPWLVDKRSKNILICGLYLYLSDNNDYYDYNTFQLLVATVIGAIKDTAIHAEHVKVYLNPQKMFGMITSVRYTYACGV